MAKLATQNRVIMYVQPSGPGTGLEPLSVSNHGRGDSTDDTIPGKTVLYGREDFGRADLKLSFRDAPGGGGVTFTINRDALASLDVLDTRRRDQGSFNIYEFFIPKGAISTWPNWLDGGHVIIFGNCTVTGEGWGGHDKNFSGNPVDDTVDITADFSLKILPFQLSALTTGETEDCGPIAVINDLDPDNELSGYPGADQIVLLSIDADGVGGTGNLLYSVNGGGSFTAFGTDPLGANENVAGLTARIISPTQYRILGLRETADAANPPEVFYQDITFGSESSLSSWNAVDIGATNNEAGEALFWPLYGRAYAAVAGDIFVSTDQGESWGTEVYTGANAIAQFAIDKDENIWAVGASNLILFEDADARGSFAAKTGPSGGGAFTSIAIADDDTIFAGNGQSLYKSTNGAASTGGWSSLKDFGANHTVVGIRLINGNSQLIQVLVQDATGTDGDVWYSFDGGNSFREIENLTNTGYLYWAPSVVDPHLIFISGAGGTAHKLSS